MSLQPLAQYEGLDLEGKMKTLGNLIEDTLTPIALDGLLVCTFRLILLLEKKNLETCPKRRVFMH